MERLLEDSFNPPWAVEGRGETFAIVNESGELLAHVPYKEEDGLEPLETQSGQIATMMASSAMLLSTLQNAKSQIEELLQDLTEDPAEDTMAQNTLAEIDDAIAMATRHRRAKT